MFHVHRLAWLAIAWLLLSTQPAAPQAPSKPVDAKAIAALIAQFGSTDFQERQTATKSLEAIGRPALAALREAAEKHEDAEVRRRAQGLVEKIENSLEQLLEDYKAYGLPLPPKDAPLVRFVPSYSVGEDRNERPNYDLGFQLEPATKNTGPVVLWGTWQSSPYKYKEVVVIDNKNLTIQEIEAWAEEGWAEDKIILAIQCRARGWDSLAQRFFEKGQTRTTASPRAVVRRVAWSYWEQELSRPKTDRSVAARHLHALIQNVPELDTKQHRSLLKSLDAALVPSKAKAGSIEALIDGLVNAGSQYNWVFSDEYADPVYRRLVERGFEAVPDLIEHLDDDRLTRGRPMGLCSLAREEDRQQYRARDIVRDLIQGLAGEDLKIGFDDPRPHATARAWWDRARQVSEEEYLLSHVLPKKDNWPNNHMLWLLTKKYPRRLPEVYRKLLDERPKMDSWYIATAVARSTLSRAEKVDLYAYAGRHKNLEHRRDALGELKDLDHERFVQLLVETLDSLPKTFDGACESCREASFANLVPYTKDSRAWQALDRIARRSEVGLRMELISWTNHVDDAPHRKEQLAFLASFLKDATVRDMKADPKRYAGSPAGHEFPRLEIRNYAALEIARLLKMEPQPQPTWDAEQWARFRDEVHEALKR